MKVSNESGITLRPFDVKIRKKKTQEKNTRKKKTLLT